MDEVTRAVWSWTMGWTAVFALHLPTVYLATLEAQRGADGSIATLAAAAILWAAGVVGGALVERVRAPLIEGGVTLAFLQLFPCLQLASAFAAAVVLSTGVYAATGRGHLTGPAGAEIMAFSHTLLTGQILALVALVLGWYACRYGIVRSPPGEPRDDRPENDPTHGG